MGETERLLVGLTPESLSNTQLLYTYLRFFARRMLIGMDVLPPDLTSPSPARSGELWHLMQVVVDDKDIASIGTAELTAQSLTTVCVELECSPARSPRLFVDAQQQYVAILPVRAIAYYFASNHHPSTVGPAIIYGISEDVTNRQDVSKLIKRARKTSDHDASAATQCSTAAEAILATSHSLESTFNDKLMAALSTAGSQYHIESVPEFQARITNIMLANDQ